VFSGIYLEIKECFLIVIDSHLTETVLKIIQEWTQPGKTSYFVGNIIV